MRTNETLTVCTFLVALAAIFGWPREDDPVPRQLTAADWAAYFERLYRATREAFDRESCRIDLLLIGGMTHATDERINARAHSAAMTAVMRAWTNTESRPYVSAGYNIFHAKLRDKRI